MVKRHQTLDQVPHLRASLELLIQEQFPKGYAPKIENPINVSQEFAPLLDPINARRVLLFETQGQVVATLSWKAFDVMSPDGNLRVAALGLVVTHPDYRNQGLSSALMKRAETAALDEGCAMMCLWSDLIDHYLSRGYLLLGGETNLKWNSSINLRSEGQTLRVRDSKTFEIEKALDLYKGMGLGPRRAASLYSYFLSLPSTYAFQTDKAYLLAGKARDLHNVVHELVGEASHYPQLLNALRASLTSTESLTIQIPFAHPQRQFLENLLGPGEEGPWVFAKILNPAQMTRFFAPQLKKLGLQIDTRQGRWRLIQGSALQSSAVLFESPDVGHMLQILWSPWPVSKIEGLPEKVKSTLSAWKVPSIYFWGMDSV